MMRSYINQKITEAQQIMQAMLANQPLPFSRYFGYNLRFFRV